MKFTDNGDGTITDTSTGLMWKQNPEEGTFTYDQAMALKSDFAGYDDWRLPTFDELASLVDRSHISPAIDVTAFPETPSIKFWSSSPYAGSAYGAWVVGFGYGYVIHYGFRNHDYAVRLVRASQ